MKLIRLILSSIILFFDRIFAPKPVSRTAELQNQIDRETAKMSLYQFHGCPFCIKVRRAMKRLNLNIELKDVMKNKEYESELIRGGGQRQVPCLCIADDRGAAQWMYESGDIIEYLEKRFGQPSA